MKLIFKTAIVFLICHHSSLAMAEKRVALVIGNSKYQSAPLKNPSNDATDVAKILKESLGFSTTLVLDADQTEMQKAIRKFSKEMKDADVRIFYFAGHGVSVDGDNYMLPVGANIKSEDEVQWEAVKSSLVLDQMEKSNEGANVLILDACRDNPLPKSSRSGQRGLDKMIAPVGSLILYATAPGQVALDGNGRNGTFTKHLLNSLAAKDVHLGDIALDVRVAVMQETGNKQVPWSESSLTRRIYLAGKSETPAQSSEQQTGDVDLQKENGASDNQKEEGSTSTHYSSSVLQAYLSAAEAGDTIAQANLGYIFDVGRSIPEDNDKAKYWYEKASNKNHWDASVNLGVMYLSGDGVTSDEKKAFELFQRGANDGHAVSQRNLGVMYQYGMHVPEDLAVAHKWFERAAAQGDTDAFVDLGDLYSYGLGVRRDTRIAFKWYLKAAKLGSADAQTEVGYFYEQGLGMPQSYQNAKLWFEKAASQDHPVGLYNLAEMYELGKGIAADPTKARMLYGKAADLGSTEAINALNRIEK